MAARLTALDARWAQWYSELMSKVDGIREELGWLKVVFAVLVAIDVSLVAWVAQNYSAANSVLVVAAIVAVAVLTVVVVWVNRLAYRKIRELENL